MPSSHNADRLVAGLIVMSLAALLGACGGGGGGSASGPSFISWTDNRNLTIVMTTNGQVQFLTNGNMYFNGQETNNIRLASMSGANVLLNGSSWANVVTVAGVAYLQCAGSSSYATVSSTGSSCPAGTGSGGSGGGTISSPVNNPVDMSGDSASSDSNGM